MKNEKIFIYGRHAVFSALANPKRRVDEVWIIKDNQELLQDIQLLLSKNNRKIKLNYVDNNFLYNILQNKVKHQGLVAKSYKLDLINYTTLFENDKFKTGVILDRLTDANNAGAIYRSAKAFDIDFIINSTKHSIIESSALLNSACGAYETTNAFITNNVSNAIKKFTSKGWWIIGLDHKADTDIQIIINKMKITDKFIFIFGSEGKGIRRLIKKNCNFIASIPNAPNTESINVSNAAAIIFYEIYKTRSNISR